MAWYNTYRPKRFEDVTGQALVKKILTNAVKKQSVRHAYLLSGSKGVGKTTLARIFASELNTVGDNPQHSIDIIEMDAASNTGIDDIRGIIESAKIPPIAAPYKIFIIDEVHMLSKSAMNALLKILEEPPQYLVFLLATTNPEKLLPTVHSRLTSLRLHNHTEKDIIARLQFIAYEESLIIDNSALSLIAKKADGSQRDAINLLETIAAHNLEKYTSSDVSQILGLVDEEILKKIHIQLIELTRSNTADWKDILDDASQAGIDPNTLLLQISDYALDRSFAGDTSLNQIIPYLIEIQSKRFSLVSNSALFGLLHALIVPVDFNPILPNTDSSPSSGSPESNKTSSSNNKAKSESKKDITQEDKKSVHEQDIDYNQKNENSVPDITEHTGAKPEQIDSKESGVSNNTTTKETIQNSFAKLLTKKDCQPMLKMMAGDVQVHNVINNTLVFSTTNGIFETQLKTQAMVAYINKHFKEDIDATFSIEVQSRIKTGDEVMFTPHPKDQKDDSDKLDSGTESNKRAESADTPNKESTSHKPIDPGKIFYSVYNELPEEIKDSKIPVFKGPLPEPEKQTDTGSSQDDWDKHSEEMFEFE